LTPLRRAPSFPLLAFERKGRRSRFLFFLPLALLNGRGAFRFYQNFPKFFTILQKFAKLLKNSLAN